MSLKVATWNVENLFRPEADASAAAYAEKLAGLSRTINEHNLDVVALQEVSNSEALEDLLGELEGNWRYELSDYPDDRGIRVGFIARTALRDREDIVALPPEPFPRPQINGRGEVLSRMGRGALGVTVGVGNAAVRLVTTHLKSKLITYPGGRFSPLDEGERVRFATYALSRRAAEAAIVRSYCNDYLANQGQTRPLVVLGDLNDGPEAQTTQMLYGPGGSQIGTRGERQPDKGDGSRLFNLAPLLPEGERRTRVYQGEGEIIDHILISRALLERVEAGSMRAPMSQLPSITDNPNERNLAQPSDHAPVMATFTL